MSLHKVEVDFDKACLTKRDDVSFLELTGCGVEMNNEGIVASGDFTGNIYLWKKEKRTPCANVKAETSIRCLLWIDNVLLFGCLNSALYCWRYITQSNGPAVPLKYNKNLIQTLYNVFGDPVSMALDSTDTRLALGTTAGYLYVFDVKRTGDGLLHLEELYNLQIHEPKKQEDGSLLVMEIWNVAWSVSDGYIATTSEDQTCKISESQTGLISSYFFVLTVVVF